MTIRTELDLTDATSFARNDVHEFWRDVRKSRPVYWHDGDPGFWVVARHADVLACYADARGLSSARGTVLDVLLSGGDSAGGKMLAVTDRPRHRELRTLMLRAFSPRVLGAVEDRVRERTSRLVRSFTGKGEFDFAAEIADHIPMNTIGDLLSIPEADREKLLRWNKLALSSADETADRLDSLEARNEIVGYFMDLVRYRRDHPGDDVVSMIATAEAGDGPLTLEEAALNCYSLVLGGDESSRVSAICAVKTLAEHPAQWRALRDGSAGVDSAVEEVLRWATPAMHFARTAVQDREIGGRRVRAGDIVTLWNTSANNDEEVFDRPRRFDLTRSPNKHVSLGHGPHFCVGAFLGRAELRALLNALTESVTGIEVCGRPGPIYSNFLNGYDSLPVAFH
ncbi:Steroid C26-monooxygenase [Streptomyces sp. ADI96-02]|uniref:cytochrome P450 n=1 Tax=unclassified Streptomyces TaxID=2593676 RepID=UPI000F54F50A|nr:cytochrome P450 [Streptomyces sp. ADI96-02]RPK57832.1 Steroid C26-monooxygenase [Streptomyces sp. ADI96-02]